LRSVDSELPTFVGKFSSTECRRRVGSNTGDFDSRELKTQQGNVTEMCDSNRPVSDDDIIIIIIFGCVVEQIEYCSSLSEILAFAANFSTDMLMTVRPVPRLSRTFKLPENNRSSYGDEISKDRVCVRLQENINTGTCTTFVRKIVGFHRFIGLARVLNSDYQRSETVDTSHARRSAVRRYLVDG